MLELVNQNARETSGYATFANRAHEAAEPREPTSGRRLRAAGVLVALALFGIVLFSGYGGARSQSSGVAAKLAVAGGCPVTIPLGSKFVFTSQQSTPQAMTTCGTTQDYPGQNVKIYWLYSGNSASVSTGTRKEWYVRAPVNGAACSYSFESVAHAGYYLSTHGWAAGGALKDSPWVNSGANSFQAVSGYTGRGVSFEYAFHGEQVSLGIGPSVPTVDATCKSEYTGGFHGQGLTTAKSDAKKDLHSFELECAQKIESSYGGSCTNGMDVYASKLTKSSSGCYFDGTLEFYQAPRGMRLTATPYSSTNGVFSARGWHHMTYTIETNGDILLKHSVLNCHLRPQSCPNFEVPQTPSTCGTSIVVPKSLEDLKRNARYCKNNNCMFIIGPNSNLINYHSQCSCTVSGDGSSVTVKSTWGTSPRTRVYSGTSSTGEGDYRHPDLSEYKQALSTMNLPPDENANKFYFAVVGQIRNLPSSMSFKAVQKYSTLSGMLKNGYCPPFELAVGGNKKSFLANEFICRVWSGTNPYVFLVGYQVISGNSARKFGFKVTFRADASGDVSLYCTYYEIDVPPVLLLPSWNHKWYKTKSASNGNAMPASSHIPTNFVCSGGNVLIKY